VPVPGGTIGIECTSAHVTSSLATADIYVVEPTERGPKDLAYKLARAVRKKAGKPYASPDVLVSIDATNIQALSGSEQVSTREAEEALEATGLGGALVFVTVLNHDEGTPDDPVIGTPYVRLDSTAISAALRSFLDEHFPKGDETVMRYTTPLIP
jgi:hypothetical protein